MKTTNYLFVAFGAAALTLTACNNDDDVLNGGQEPGVVNIVTSINGPQTRVPVLDANGAGSFQGTDTLKLAVYGSSTGIYQANYYPGTTKLYWEDVKANAGEGNYTFAAWYNGNEPADLVADATFDVAAAKDKDLLLATPVTVGEGAQVNLNFKHAMHKLVVNVTYDGDFTGVNKENVSIKPVGMNATTEIDIKAGTVAVGEANATKGTYAAQLLDLNNACSFILAPQKLTTDAEWLEINLDGQPLTFYVPARYTTSGSSTEALSQLNSGEVLTLNLTIKKVSGGTDPDKTEIVLTTGQITAWNSQGTVEGEVQVNGNN